MNKVTKIISILLFLAIAAYGQQKGGTFTDTRDSKTYKWVKIGEQIWMAENLNYKVGNSWCYDNKQENCEKYGRLYDWATANEACPKGWHLPSNAEWNGLFHYTDGTSGTEELYSSETAGLKLKAINGFSAMLGGNHNNGSFYDFGHNGYWWSSTERDEDFSFSRTIKGEYAYWDYYYKTYGFSVRCIKN